MKFCTQQAAADFKLDERHVIKNENVALDRLRVGQNVFLVIIIIIIIHCVSTKLYIRGVGGGGGRPPPPPIGW